MHKLLKRQVNRLLGDMPVSGEMQALLEAVSATYEQSDKKQTLLERSLKLSSDESLARYESLEKELERNELQQNQLQNALGILNVTLDSTEEGIIAFDKDFKLIKYNQRYLNIWELEADQLKLGMASVDLSRLLVEKLINPETFCELRSFLHANPDKYGEAILELKSGRVLEWFAPPQPGDSDLLRINYFRDITVSYRTAEELNHSRQSLIDAQRIADVGSWEWDLSTNILNLSDEFQSLLNYSSAKVGKGLQTLLNLVPENEQERVETTIQRLLFADESFDIEHQLKRIDGTCGSFLSRGKVMRDERGKPHRILGVVHDISSQKEVESQLRLASRVFEVSAQGILITDAEVTILDVNQALCDMSGWHREELIGHSPAVFRSGYHDASFYRRMWSKIRATGEWSGEIWDRRKDGSLKANWLHVSAIKNPSGNIVNYVGMCSDITEIKETEEQLQKLAYHDPLTGLANRALFQEVIKDESRKLRYDGNTLALMYLDLDRFKYVNDSLGHLVGDELLVAVAERLKATVRSTDIVARHGGDEFIVALVQPGDRVHVEAVATNIINELSKPYHHADQDIYIGVSIGICQMPEQADCINDAMRNADSALYLAKESGKGCYRFWDEKHNKYARRRVEVEAKLREAIKQNQLILYYQPQIDLNTGELLAYEALVRWEHPEDGLIFPDEFIPLAEETGLITDLGCWVLNEACRQIHCWENQGFDVVPVAINISPQNFGSMPIENGIASALETNKVRPDLLEVEITESSAMQDPKHTRRVLEKLRLMGVSVSIDDFGTGYSSLSYLKSFPVRKLKIDRSFVMDLATDTNDRDIAKAIVNLGQSLSMSVVAEGVETEEQRQILEDMGCDSLQGYLISRPCPPEDAQMFMQQRAGNLHSKSSTKF